MRTITQYYGITRSVPFLDVDVDDDNRMFVDPFKIRMGLGPATFARAANACTSSYFDEVTSAVVSGHPGHRARGLDLLQHFEEPRETRLGMSKQGFDGHGGAEGVGQDIWDTLDGDASALVRVGVLHQIEDIPLFVPGIDKDITSDLTTRIIFEPLAEYTQDCITHFPELAGRTGIQTFTRQVWDPASRSWAQKALDLPTVDGSPLLLIPDEWCTRNLLLNATRLYETELLSYVQMERAVRTDKGKLLKTPKDRLQQDPQLQRGYETIIRIVEDAHGKGTNIVANFKRWAQQRYYERYDETS
ncbi:MAG: hypothetical protein V9G08_09580 [Dermatophilaceae bacterium]